MGLGSVVEGHDPERKVDKNREEPIVCSIGDPSGGENKHGSHVGCGPERSGFGEEGTCRRQVGPVGGTKDLSYQTYFSDQNSLGAHKKRREVREDKSIPTTHQETMALKALKTPSMGSQGIMRRTLSR